MPFNSRYLREISEKLLIGSDTAATQGWRATMSQHQVAMAATSQESSNRFLDRANAAAGAATSPYAVAAKAVVDAYKNTQHGNGTRTDCHFIRVKCGFNCSPPSRHAAEREQAVDLLEKKLKEQDDMPGKISTSRETRALKIPTSREQQQQRRQQQQQQRQEQLRQQEQQQQQRPHRQRQSPQQGFIAGRSRLSKRRGSVNIEVMLARGDSAHRAVEAALQPAAALQEYAGRGPAGPRRVPPPPRPIQDRHTKIETVDGIRGWAQQQVVLGVKETPASLKENRASLLRQMSTRQKQLTVLSAL